MASDYRAVRLHRGHSGHLGQVGYRTVEGRFHRQRAEMSHLAQRAHLDEVSVAEDAHAVTECLHLAHDVRREKYGLPTVARLVDAVAKRLFHKRVEPTRRLVKHQQVGANHQRADQDDLLPVPLRVSTDLLGGIEVETGDQFVSVGRVNLTLDSPEQMKGLGAGE